MPEAILPIVIAEERIRSVVQAIIFLPEDALFIERVNTEVEVERCRVVNGAVLIRGRVIINVPFKTGRLESRTGFLVSGPRTVCGDIRHCTAFIPFSLIANLPAAQEGDQCQILTACVTDLILDPIEGSPSGLLGLSGGPRTDVTNERVGSVGTLNTTETLGIAGARRPVRQRGMSGELGETTGTRAISGRRGRVGAFEVSGRMSGQREFSGNFGMTGNRGSGCCEASGRCGTTGNRWGRRTSGQVEALETTGNLDTTGTVVAAGLTGDPDQSGATERLLAVAEICIRFRVTREQTVDVRATFPPTERFVTFPDFR